MAEQARAGPVGLACFQQGQLPAVFSQTFIGRSNSLKNPMAQIRFDLNPAKLSNPDLDLRYRLPDRLGAIPESTMTDNGYDYSEDEPSLLMVFVNSEQPDADVEIAIRFLSSNTLLENKVLDAATIFTSDDGQEWLQRYPSG